MFPNVLGRPPFPRNLIFHQRPTNSRTLLRLGHILDMPNKMNVDVDGWLIVDARVTFLSKSDGGRHNMPDFNGNPSFRPDIVIQDSNIRTATYDAQGRGNERYLGVEFVGGSESPEFGAMSECKLRLVNHPRVDYCEVQYGATFTIRDGARVIGFGIIRSSHFGIAE